VRDLDLAQPRHVGERRAAHPREAHRSADVDVREVAPDPAQHRQAEVVEPVGDAQPVGHDADQDEQRDGEQRKAVEAVEGRFQGEPAGVPVGECVPHAGADEGEPDRHPDQQQQRDDEADHPQLEDHRASAASKNLSG
jgi:hypothetical protein